MKVSVELHAPPPPPLPTGYVGPRGGLGAAKKRKNLTRAGNRTPAVYSVTIPTVPSLLEVSNIFVIVGKGVVQVMLPAGNTCMDR
jgi:hypothetical protein